MARHEQLQHSDTLYTLQAEAREAESKKQAEEAAAKLQSAAEARQRLAAERRTLQEAQATLDAALLEVRPLHLDAGCCQTRPGYLHQLDSSECGVHMTFGCRSLWAIDSAMRAFLATSQGHMSGSPMC